jgi:hypothetical protein
MNSTFLIKVKFENTNDIYDFKFTDSVSPTFFEQQEKFLCSIGYEKDKKMYCLYNSHLNKFFISTNEIKQYSNVVNIFKNCAEFAKKIVKETNQYLEVYKNNVVRVSIINQLNNNTTGNELKNIVFALQNYFLIDAFSEEFIAYDGIQQLIEILEISTGHTKVFTIFN